MTTQTHSEGTNESTTSGQSTDLGNLSFAEYQAARRGESIPKSDESNASAAGAKASGQKKSSESETEESEVVETTDESDDEGSEEELSAKDSEDDKPRKKGGFQRRIDKLNSRIADRDREIEFLRTQAQRATEPKESKVEAKPASVEGKPNPDDFETHAEFNEALMDWKLEQKSKDESQKLHKAKLETEQANRQKTYLERVKAFSETNDDFQEVLTSSASPMTPVMQEAILDSEVGPALVYELAKNPEEAKRIAELPPIAAAREMGRLEVRLSRDASTKTETKQLTKAPKPLEPLGKSSSTASKSIADPNISFAEYEELRRKQMKRRG